MTQYLIAHDLGTSGNKATLYTADGKLVASCTERYPLHVAPQNHAEQDPEDWWRAVCVSTRKLLEGVDPKHIAAVSFSGQMMGCVCVDRDGRPLYNAMIWADMRAVEQEERIRASFGDEGYYRLTGHKLSASYGGFKLMWLKDQFPEIYARTYKMLNAKDYAILKLTGRFVTEHSDASSTGFYAIEKLVWSDELLKAAGIDRNVMAEAHASTDVAGYVTAEAARLTGLAEGTPVVFGGGDGPCAAVGAGCVRDGMANSSLGTSSWISVTTTAPVFDPQMISVTWPHLIAGMYMPCGAMQSGGGAFNWATDMLLDPKDPERHARANELAEQAPIGSKGLLFLPYLLGERSPRWDPECRGAFIGLTMDHGKGEMLRSVMEGVAYNLDIILSAMKRQQRITDITVIGGGAVSRLWRQIFADVYRTPILLPNYLNEAASMGAAVCGGVGVGLYEDFSAIDRYIRIVDRIMPIEENARQYDRYKEPFDESYFALKSIVKKLR
ncbi:MAG: xylulokinase [Eubacteriales bacterium]|nr:xylulokinase [Eubacteriales bacterium]